MASEVFNYDGVKTKMDSLQTVFDNFAKELNDLNVRIETKINNNAMSAIFGTAGETVKRVWDENSSSFSSFKANFEEWSQLISTVCLNNLTFEANAYRTINGKDKITSSKLLDGMGYTTIEVPSDNGEEVFEVEQVDPWKDLDKFMADVTSAEVSEKTVSILDNIGEVQGASLFQKGDHMTLTSGSKVVIDGHEYEVAGFASKEGESGMYMWLTVPGEEFLYRVPADGNGNVEKTGDRRTLFESDYRQIYRYNQLVTINPGWDVTSLAAPDDASYLETVISNQYISKTCNVVVSDTSQLVTNVKANRTFIVAEGKRVQETDYLDTTVNSQIFYNPYPDFMDGVSEKGTVADQYWIDSNNDGYVTYLENLNTTNDAHSVQTAFDKVKEREVNGKNFFIHDGSNELIRIVDDN